VVEELDLGSGCISYHRCATGNQQRKRLSDRQKLNLLPVQKSGEDQNHSWLKHQGVLKAEVAIASSAALVWNSTTWAARFIFLFSSVCRSSPFVLSEQFSRFSAPHSMLESGNAIDREAVERGTLINLPAIRTKLWIGYIHTARAAGKEAQDSHNAKF
jgi:hypothetical protein